MSFLKSLFWGNKAEEVKKASIAKAKPISKPAADAQARVVDMYTRVLPGTKIAPDPVQTQIKPEPIENSAPIIPEKKEEKKPIEFSLDLLKEMETNGLDVDLSDLDKPKKFNPTDPNSCVRDHLRADSSEILGKQHISVKTVNLSNPQEVSNDILSNISAWWLQVISSVPKEVWDKLSFDFFMGVDEFSFIWEVRGILNNDENTKRYGVQFIDPPEDQIKILNRTIGTAKLSKFTKENNSVSEIDLIN